MKKKEKKKEEAPSLLILGKENYKWMFIGLGIIFLGFLLMLGGGSDDPNVFDADALFSARRITIAPILIVLGFVVEIYAIMANPRKTTLPKKS